MGAIIHNYLVIMVFNFKNMDFVKPIIMYQRFFSDIIPLEITDRLYNVSSCHGNVRVSHETIIILTRCTQTLYILSSDRCVR